MLRNNYFGVLLAALFLASGLITAKADDCPVCTELNGLRSLDGVGQIANVSPVADSRKPVSFTITGGNFCSGDRPAMLAAEVDSLADRIFARAENVAIAVQKCAPACTPAASGDDYCGLGTVLSSDGTYLNRLGDGLSAGALIFEGAASSGRLIAAEIGAQLSLYAAETADLLKQGLVALRDNDVSNLSPKGWALNGRDIGELGQALSLMGEFGLAQGNAAVPARAIRMAGNEMAQLGVEIEVELTRARVTNPADRAALAVRILQVADNLSWGIASAYHGADTANGTAISTVANAVPNAARSAGYIDAGRCFTKLSLAAAIAGEGMSMTRDLLGECRPFAGCATTDTGVNPDPLTLTAFLERLGKTATVLRATTATMCKAN